MTAWQFDRSRVARLATIALVLSLLGIGVVSLTPTLAPPGQQHIDKLLHVAAYAVPGLFAAAAAGSTRVLFALVLLIWLYGGLIEMAQSFMPPRLGSAVDAASNALGTCIGAVLGSMLLKLARRAGWLAADALPITRPGPQRP